METFPQSLVEPSGPEPLMIELDKRFLSIYQRPDDPVRFNVSLVPSDGLIAHVVDSHPCPLPNVASAIHEAILTKKLVPLDPDKIVVKVFYIQD
jgi:hypothetical protein